MVLFVGRKAFLYCIEHQFRFRKKEMKIQVLKKQDVSIKRYPLFFHLNPDSFGLARFTKTLQNCRAI
jgi:hypothetical protein